MRGFIDCDEEDWSVIRRIVADHSARSAEFFLGADQVDLYMEGWIYPETAINGAGHVFFGAAMRVQGVQFVFSQISAVANAVEEVSGLFLVSDDEDGDSIFWKIESGGVAVSGDLPGRL
ncbi:hypothetical protein OG689_13570 [Kitasatospora sp. NBC_00240]|uniref:hypothetical protein n=1 Tax=Kitasatospora sp. NBC_00240 TaxID=2903567 RepID=UPI0022506DD8|nr:hypothetical protein [Kitasatospora sp. NBC_00240]MCX5210307.1 hypothetical protein [Kitasatospora sp. NBC_00240]